MQNFLIQLPRNLKRLLLISIDVISIWIAFWLALMIRLDDFFWIKDGYTLTKASPDQLYNTFLIITAVTIPILILFRLYRSITRYISIETYIKILQATLISVLISTLIIYYINYPIPKSALLLYFIILTAFMFINRFIAKSYLLSRTKLFRKKILIFGLDQSSIHLANILKNDHEVKPVGFISNNNIDKKTTVSELPVYMSYDIENIVKKKNIHEILIIPTESPTELSNIINSLESCEAKLRKVPNINLVAKGNIKIDDFKKIDIEDLLGRDSVKPDPYLLKSCVENKVVMITGAGGSIGSELSRQIINLNPKKIILVELSEFFLYEIDNELNDINKKENMGVTIKSYLGSVTDQDFVKSIFEYDNIDTVYHAAAYKHVPLVEHNPISAIKTNIIGTNILAQHAYKTNVENFVLISSDKAVRPTNIMGATKRFTEIILQALQDVVEDLPTKKCRTKFCMVRFGNVLDTSGSVVPLFKKQIEKGGPVTVTDARVIRYFMTIKEAAELVIQAGSLSKGGDVFLLEMGEPVSILELAKKIIKLSGHEIKTPEKPDVGIEIVFTGLRAGEKLYEELLIGDNVNKTVHPYIMSSNEEKLSYDEILEFITKFDKLSLMTPLDEVHKMLYQSVKGYIPYKDNVVDIASTKK